MPEANTINFVAVAEVHIYIFVDVTEANILNCLSLTEDSTYICADVAVSIFFVSICDIS